MRVEVERFNMYDFDDSFESIIERLNELQAKYPKHKLAIDAYMDSSRGRYDVSEDPVFEVYYVE